MKVKFSKNVIADPDAFYMSCPEIVGKHITQRLSGFDTCVELCSAVGLLAIQLAKKMKRVYAIEIDSKRIESAKKNTKLYNVYNKIDFIQGDVLDINLLKKISADVAIIDPDWSKEGTKKTEHILNIDETQPSLRKMYSLTRKYITSNCVSRIPKTWTFETLKDLGPCEIENIKWNNSLKFKVAYFFEGIKNCKETTVYFD